MEFEERKELIEKISLRWKPKGIEELKTYGNFQKYTPLFHFHISEPYAYGKDENFIFVTELFGNINQKPEDALLMNFGGMRRQLQGNYGGLKNIVLQGFSEPHIKPFKHFTEGIGEYWAVMGNPTQALGAIEEKDRLLFDNSLLYLENVTRFFNPKSFNLPTINNEMFTNSHFFP